VLQAAQEIENIMSEQEIDSQLKELLDLLRPVPERNSDAMYRSRTRFSTDLDTFFPDGVQHRRGSVRAQTSSPTPMPVVAPTRVAARPKPGLYRPVFAYLALTLLIVVAMFSGGFVTVLAAGSALPGDALYPLKLNVEQARISLTPDTAQQSELYLEFAQNRLDEMNTLAALGQYDNVAPLATQFNLNVALAVNMARRLADRDPERALRLEGQALQTLGLLKPTIDLVISNAPPPLQPALQAAFERAEQATPAVDNSNANENNAGGNANSNGNGNPGDANNNGNPANRNSNTNSNSNANSNSNGSPGTTINGNSNDNSNANPNANPNSNKNNNGKDDNKNNNGKDDNKNNNGKDDNKNNNGKNK
jgi:hypothetical protein